MRTGRSTLTVALTMVVLSITALSAASVVNVSQKGRAFTATNLQILRGQVLHVSNDDQFVHQIYIGSASFNFESDEQEPGTSIDIPFSKAGLFEVRCHIHPKMLLTVDAR